MSLSILKKLLSTYTPNQPSTQYDVRTVSDRILIQHQLPKLAPEEKVFIRGNTLVFSSCSSVRAYEVYQIQHQLIQEITRSIQSKTPIIGVRFL